MSEPADLFEKANALVGRYRGERPPAPDYPVLTDVVESVPAEAPPQARFASPAPRRREPAERNEPGGNEQSESERSQSEPSGDERSGNRPGVGLTADLPSAPPHDPLIAALADIEARLLERLDRSATEIIEAAFNDRRQVLEAQVLEALDASLRNLKTELEAQLRARVAYIVQDTLAAIDLPPPAR